MKCKKRGCEGIINTEVKKVVRVGCFSPAIVHPCNICGKLHWPSGVPAVSRKEMAEKLN